MLKQLFIIVWTCLVCVIDETRCLLVSDISTEPHVHSLRYVYLSVSVSVSGVSPHVNISPQLTAEV